MCWTTGGVKKRVMKGVTNHYFVFFIVSIACEFSSSRFKPRSAGGWSGGAGQGEAHPCPSGHRGRQGGCWGAEGAFCTSSLSIPRVCWTWRETRNPRGSGRRAVWGLSRGERCPPQAPMLDARWGSHHRPARLCLQLPRQSTVGFTSLRVLMALAVMVEPPRVGTSSSLTRLLILAGWPGRVRSPGKSPLALAFALLDVREGESIWSWERRSCPQPWVHLGVRAGFRGCSGPRPPAEQVGGWRERPSV